VRERFRLRYFKRASVLTNAALRLGTSGFGARAVPLFSRRTSFREADNFDFDKNLSGRRPFQKNF
jgi:hypothetical protein